MKKLFELLKNLLSKSAPVPPPVRVVPQPVQTQPPVSTITTVSTITNLPEETTKVLPDFGVELIKCMEGCKLTAYKDIVGVWTIGYGATGTDIVEGLVWTQQQADERLAADLRSFRLIVAKYAEKQDIMLNHNQLSALMSFTYNLGRSCLVTLMHERTLAQVADAMLLYHRAGGKPVRGLKIRRSVEREIFLLPSSARDYNVLARVEHFRKEIKE